MSNSRKVIEAYINELTRKSPKEVMKSAQKKRLRETKKRQIEAIDNNAQRTKKHIRDQYKNRIDALNNM